MNSYYAEAQRHWSELAVKIRNQPDVGLFSREQQLESAHRCELRAEAAQQGRVYDLCGY